MRIAGAKNAVLKMMAAAVLTEDLCVLRNVPKISDVAILREVMTDIGFEVRRVNGDALELQAREAEWPFVPLEAAHQDARELHPARTHARALRPGDPAESRGRPDRAAAGRLPRRPPWSAWAPTIVYRNGYYFAAAPPGGLRGGTDRLPDRDA